MAGQRRQSAGVLPSKILKTREFSALRRNTRFPRNAWWSQAESNCRPLDVFQARSQLIAAVRSEGLAVRLPSSFCKPGVQALGAPAARSSAANGVRVCAKSETPTDAALRLCEPRYRTCPPRLARKTPAGLHLWSRNGRIGASAEPVSASPVLFSNFLAPSSRDRFARIRRSPLAVDSSAHPRQSGLGWRSYGATSEDLKLIPILGSRPS